MVTAIIGDMQPLEGVPSARQPRVAVVHDQLYTVGGAEKVLAEVLVCYPGADVFALFDVLIGEQRDFLAGRKVATTMLQRLPWLRRLHRFYFPLMPFAVEQLDLSGYDIVISSSYLAAKGVIVAPDQLHVCYLHSPMRYAWDMQHDYLKDMKLDRGLRSLVARMMLHYLRAWDVNSSNRVDLFLANSHFVARRARKAYRRDCLVVHPPVEVDRFVCGPALEERAGHYLTLGRLVPYKRFDIVVEAFNAMPERRLVVIGEGSDRARLEALAGPNVTILGRQSDAAVNAWMQQAAGFIYAAQEDFGIAPVEAMACGTPVIGLGRGGLTETVKPVATGSAATGVLFNEPTAASLIKAVDWFESNQRRFSHSACRLHALTYASSRFRMQLTEAVDEAWQEMAVSQLGTAEADGTDQTRAA